MFLVVLYTIIFLHFGINFFLKKKIIIISSYWPTIYPLLISYLSFNNNISLNSLKVIEEYIKNVMLKDDIYSCIFFK